MELIIDGLYQLFFQSKIVSLDENENAIIVFVIACGVVGTLAVFLDLAFFIVRGSSLLEIKHSLKNTFIFLLAWSSGASIMALVGQMMNIFQVSLAATVLVGFTWPLLFTSILKDLKDKELAAEPEQQVTSEE